MSDDTVMSFNGERMTRAIGGAARSALFATVLCAMACVGDNGIGPSVRPPSSTIGTVQVTPLNAIMAVGETLQVGVVGHTLDGGPLASFDSVMYVLQNITDSAVVRLSPTGLVTALVPSNNNPVLVDVIAFKDGLARADQLVIQVTATAIAGATLSIQPLPGDSVTLTQNYSKFIVPVIQNSLGDHVDNPMFRYTYHPSDVPKMVCNAPSFPAIGGLSSAQLLGSFCQSQISLNQIRAQARDDSVWVIASATVYGVPLRDSVLYRLTNPTSAYVFLQANNFAVGGGSALIGTTYVAPGATVTFYNLFDPSLATSVDFVLDDPSAASVSIPAATVGDSVGNVIGLPGGQYSNRNFYTPGTYNYTATVHGSVAPFTGASVSGMIVVK